MLFVCLLILKHEPTATICIVTSSDILRRQLKSDFSKVTLKSLNSISFADVRGSITKNDYFFIDETDLTLKDPVSFDNDAISGIYYIMHAKRSFFFYATLSKA